MGSVPRGYLVPARGCNWSWKGGKWLIKLACHRESLGWKRGNTKREWCTRWWFQRFFIFIPIWGRFPFWLIFFRWVETTNQLRLIYICNILYIVIFISGEGDLGQVVGCPGKNIYIIHIIYILCPAHVWSIEIVLFRYMHIVYYNIMLICLVCRTRTMQTCNYTGTEGVVEVFDQSFFCYNNLFFRFHSGF